MKRKLRFTLEHRPKDKFVVGTIYRFKWADMYRALQIVTAEVQTVDLQTKLNSLLGSDREMIHSHLFEVLQALEYDGAVNSDRIKCAGWIIACYGYVRGIPTLNQEQSSTTWPHPAPLRRKRKTRYFDYKEELKCPVCGRQFVPPKRYKTKKVILKWFAGQIGTHLVKECK